MDRWLPRLLQHITGSQKARCLMLGKDGDHSSTPEARRHCLGQRALIIDGCSFEYLRVNHVFGNSTLQNIRDSLTYHCESGRRSLHG